MHSLLVCLCFLNTHSGSTRFRRYPTITSLPPFHHHFFTHLCPEASHEYQHGRTCPATEPCPTSLVTHIDEDKHTITCTLLYLPHLYTGGSASCSAQTHMPTTFLQTIHAPFPQHTLFLQTAASQHRPYLLPSDAISHCLTFSHTSL